MSLLPIAFLLLHILDEATKQVKCHLPRHTKLESYPSNSPHPLSIATLINLFISSSLSSLISLTCIMETPAVESSNTDFNSTIDASSPFRSVKEAVAIFGELFIPSPRVDKEKSNSSVTSQSPSIPASPASEFHCSPKHLAIDKQAIEGPDKPPTREIQSSPKRSRFSIERNASDLSLPIQSAIISQNNIVKQEPMLSPRNTGTESHGNIVHGNDLVMMLMVLKKLESEVQETKMELKLLKERESETEIAVASLNAELHKSMSKIAKAEATEAAKAAAEAAKAKSTISSEKGKREIATTDGEKTRELMIKNLDSPTLAQILSISDYEGYFRKSKKTNNKLMKKKPIIPLVTDIFPWKKRSSPPNNLLSPYFSSHMYSS